MSTGRQGYPADIGHVLLIEERDRLVAENKALAARCKGLETTAIRLEGELAECKSYLAAAEKGHDAAHEACVQYEAALREAMGWNWLTDYELIPADVRSRLEALTLETNSVSVSSKSASAAETAAELPCDNCGRGVDEHAGIGMPCPETSAKPACTGCYYPTPGEFVRRQDCPVHGPKQETKGEQNGT